MAGVLRRYLRNPWTTLVTWIRAMGHDTALDAALVGCPTLLVHGERDAVVPDRFVALLQGLLRDVEVRQIEGASHAVALDPIDVFTDATIRFLARRYSGGRNAD